MDTIEIVVACNEAYTVRTWGAAVLRPYKSAAKTASTNRAGMPDLHVRSWDNYSHFRSLVLFSTRLQQS